MKQQMEHPDTAEVLFVDTYVVKHPDDELVEDAGALSAYIYSQLQEQAWHKAAAPLYRQCAGDSPYCDEDCIRCDGDCT
jgi:hypothetical protein